MNKLTKLTVAVLATAAMGSVFAYTGAPSPLAPQSQSATQLTDTQKAALTPDEQNQLAGLEQKIQNGTALTSDEQTTLNNLLDKLNLTDAQKAAFASAGKASVATSSSWTASELTPFAITAGLVAAGAIAVASSSNSHHSASGTSGTSGTTGT